MPQVVWTPTAVHDLERLQAFFFDENPEAATRAVSTIRAAMNALGSGPDFGRAAYGMSHEYRERVIPFGQSAYVALYRMELGELIVLAVKHGREASYSQAQALG